MYEDLLGRVKYNECTGIFTWRKTGNPRFDPRFAGKEIKNVDKDGYLQVILNGKNVRLHRLAWFICYGYVPDEIDHINRVKDDNRILNLREVSHAENMNNTGLRKDNSSGFKGVGFIPKTGKYRARITTGGNRLSLGVSDTADGAKKLIDDYKKG